MNIEQKELINIIREELAEALGMDQQFSGATPEVEAENALSQALLALKAAGYTREEVIEMVDAEYELQEDSMADDPVPYEEAEAEERAAEDPEQDPYITGRGADVKQEGSCGEPRKYFKIK